MSSRAPPTSAVAIAAVRFRLAEGETNPVLSLPVASFAARPTPPSSSPAPPRSTGPRGRRHLGRPRLPRLHDLGPGRRHRRRHRVGVPGHRARRRRRARPGHRPRQAPNGPEPVDGSVFRLIFGTPVLTTRRHRPRPPSTLPPLALLAPAATARQPPAAPPRAPLRRPPGRPVRPRGRSAAAAARLRPAERRRAVRARSAAPPHRPVPAPPPAPRPPAAPRRPPGRRRAPRRRRPPPRRRRTNVLAGSAPPRRRGARGRGRQQPLPCRRR